MSVDSITCQLPFTQKEAGGTRSSCSQKPWKKTSKQKRLWVANNGCCRGMDAAVTAFSHRDTEAALKVYFLCGQHVFALLFAEHCGTKRLTSPLAPVGTLVLVKRISLVCLNVTDIYGSPNHIATFTSHLQTLSIWWMFEMNPKGLRNIPSGLPCQKQPMKADKIILKNCT